MTRTMNMDDAGIKELATLMKKNKADTFRIVDKTKNSDPTFVILTWKKYKEISDILEGIEETEEILRDKGFMSSLRKSEKQIKAGQGIPWKEAKKRLKP
jgi:PHD/YefM family antitoxin component YafN of YafNO toxin-antitoxin module